jgi:hypothetical protein
MMKSVPAYDRARDSIDLVAASVDTSLGIEEHAIFGEETRRVVLTEDVVRLRVSKVDML